MTTESKPFKTWYERNKDDLNDKRKRRYQEDAIYREAARKRARDYRRTKNGVGVLPPGAEVSFQDAADAVGVTVWTLREWRKKNYFPEPLRHKGQLWFSSAQVQHLRNLKTFFDSHGVRVSQRTREELDVLTNFIVANW